tara:strand:+ start:4123 stop:4326 length:204 start_codon:yes stop_codon:yes gene_type:complete
LQRWCAANGELRYRRLDNVETTAGPAARGSHDDWAGYCDAGFLIMPKTLEPVARVATSQGAVGDCWE